MSDNNRGGKMLMGMVVAGMAGYLAGVLTAPKSGSETRQDIKNSAGRVVADIQERIENLREDIDDLIVIATDKSYELRGRAKNQLNDSIEAARDARSKAATITKAFRDGEADEPELNKALKQLKDAKKNLTKYLKS